MEILWKVHKKRGNYRPVLSWAITLEPSEMALGLAPLPVDTGIPMPCCYWEPHCYPGQHERRGAASQGSWEVITPSHRSGKAEGRMVLPWREENVYPEVAEGFERVRSAMEKALSEAARSLPMHEEGRLELGEMARKRLAPGLVADRLLAAAMKKVA